MEKCTASIRLVKFPDPIQGKLPIKPDAIRGSERIRARAYRDPRLTGTTMLVVLAISEFVTGRGQPAARLKLATIRKWTHGKDLGYSGGCPGCRRAGRLRGRPEANLSAIRVPEYVARLVRGGARAAVRDRGPRCRTGREISGIRQSEISGIHQIMISGIR